MLWWRLAVVEFSVYVINDLGATIGVDEEPFFSGALPFEDAELFGVGDDELVFLGVFKVFEQVAVGCL
jgi:hypothetical protein